MIAIAAAAPVVPGGRRDGLPYRAARVADRFRRVRQPSRRRPDSRLSCVLEPAQAAVKLVQAAMDAIRVGMNNFEVVAEACLQAREPALDPLQTAGMVVHCGLDAVELYVQATQQMQRVAIRLLGHEERVSRSVARGKRDRGGERPIRRKPVIS